jgi:hypothetical protein
MRVPSVKASRAHHILCPFCESGELGFVGEGVARCNSCALPLLGSALETLQDVVGCPTPWAATPASAATPRCAGFPTACSTVRRAARRYFPSKAREDDGFRSVETAARGDDARSRDEPPCEKAAGFPKTSRFGTSLCARLGTRTGLGPRGEAAQVSEEARIGVEERDV